MKKSALYILSILYLISFAFSSGCGNKIEVMSAPYANETLTNYQDGKNFLDAGRYELAKESFTLALASSRNPQMRYILMQEIDSTNMMIQTRR